MTEPAGDYSEEDRATLGEAAIGLLADWGLNSEQQVRVLGLDADSPASLEIVMGSAPLPQDDDVLERAGRVLNLGLILNMLFNYEAERLKGWMVLPNEELGNQTPYNFISDYGVTGLAWVEDHFQQKQAEQNTFELSFEAVS